MFYNDWQLAPQVKGRLLDMIEDKYKGFDEFDDETLLLNFMMIEVC